MDFEIEHLKHALSPHEFKEEEMKDNKDFVDSKNGNLSEEDKDNREDLVKDEKAYKKEIQYKNEKESKSKEINKENVDKLNEKERNRTPLSNKYKKTNLQAAFGKLLNEKNLISELRKNFLKSLTKLNDNDTKEIAFKELKDLVNNFCTPDALRIYLNSLSTNYTTCSLAAKEIQAVLLGYIASVFQDKLIDALDKPPSILKTVARICDILLNYLKVKIT
jgi:hypothetical protein